MHTLETEPLKAIFILIYKKQTHKNNANNIGQLFWSYIIV